jgi:hypothetical protein
MPLFAYRNKIILAKPNKMTAFHVEFGPYLEVCALSYAEYVLL